MKKIVLGCKPSKLDGTEQEYVVRPNLRIPDSYTYISMLSPVIDQGSTNTCVPCSISSHLNWNYNADHSIARKDNGININEIYSVREDKSGDNGMTIKEALHYLYKHGVSSKSGSMKIRRYAKVNSEMSLKQAIIMNGPCIGALRVYNDSKEFWIKRSGDQFLGGHAIALVGWNKLGFVIRNSWGHYWGNQGYTVIKYEDFNKFIELWTIID